MNAALWTAQVVLALAFLATGATKVLRPRSALAQRMSWVEDFSDRSVTSIGVLEVLGGLGVLLPGLVGVATPLVPLAALGLALTMLGAAIVHLRRNEPAQVVINVVLLALAAFVAWGRVDTHPL